MPVNWNLAAQPVNPLQALQAFGMAQQQQQQRAMQEQDQMQRQREFQLRERAAGLQEQKFTREQQQAALGQVAQAAADVLRRPEAERAQAWDSYIDQFAQSDPSVAQFKGQYSEQRLRALLAQTGGLDDFNKANDPKLNITGTGNGSYVVQRGNQLLDPASGQWIDYGRGAQPTQQQAAPQQGGKTIDQFGAKAMRESMGPQAFEQWKQKHGITEIGGGTVAPPPGFVLD